MSIFQPRNRVEIFREMAARYIARSKATGLTTNSVGFHLLAAAANEDAEQYVQIARLRNLFSIDRATGSDLDDRAAEIVPGLIPRRGALYASGTVEFTRTGTTGTVTIPQGTIVAARDNAGEVRFQTTAAASITAGNTSSGAVAVTALVAGARANVASGTIVRFVSRIAGVTGVSNAAALTSGQDRESDGSFRYRIRAYVAALSRGTPIALESFARQVLLDNGRRVVFASVVEPAVPTGTVHLYIDDGTGAAAEYDSTYIGTYDVFLASAAGGEVNVQTSNYPLRDDGSLIVELDTGSGYAALTRGVDFELQPTTGTIELDSTLYPSGLTAGDAMRAQYRYFTGLIAETQKVIDGDPADELTYPGVRAAGVQVIVDAAHPVYQSLKATISVLNGYDPSTVAALVETAVQNYINALNIGEFLIVAELIERAMGVEGMLDFRIVSLTGSYPAANQVILPSQVARIIAASITLT